MHWHGFILCWLRFCRLLRLCAEASRPCCSSPVRCGHDSVHLRLQRHGCISFRRTVCCIPWQRRGFCCSRACALRTRTRFGFIFVARATIAYRHFVKRQWLPSALSQIITIKTPSALKELYYDSFCNALKRFTVFGWVEKSSKNLSRAVTFLLRAS